MNDFSLWHISPLTKKNESPITLNLQAIAIRKIRGLNSDKKGQKEGTRANRVPTPHFFAHSYYFYSPLECFLVAQAKSVNSETSSDNVKLIIGPSGTVLIFPKDKALPSIFDSKPCRLGSDHFIVTSDLLKYC